MVEHAWVKHAGTGGVTSVPKDAIPQLRQSGWEPMTDKEVAARDQAEADAVAAAEDEMRAKTAPETTDNAVSRRRATISKGND